MSNYKRGEMVWVFYYDENDKVKIDQVLVIDYWEDTKQVWYLLNDKEHSAFLSNTDRSREVLIDRKIDEYTKTFTEYIDEIALNLFNISNQFTMFQSELKCLKKLKDEQA